jgi:SGNH hydrolase-like domain, acetyltransferase AlgX
MQNTLPGSTASVQREHGGPTDPSHDEQLRRGILPTDVTRSVAWFLSLLFLASIYAVPLAQAYLEHREDEDSSLTDLFRRKPTAENLRQFEKGVEDASYAKAWVQPRLQLLLTRAGRAGNKRALVGHDGWLYYTPGVLHVAGPGFLEPAIIKNREREALDAEQEPIHADPRGAILAFHRALAARGVRLVLLPMPDKAALDPGQLHGRGPEVGAAQNVDFDRFIAEMRGAGVAVLDARKSAPEQREEPLYLVQDTHFAPRFMERIAGDLAELVKGLQVLPAATTATSLRAVEQPAARVGDLVDMLKLPEDQSLFAPQSVVVKQVQDASGTPWEPDPAAEVLLLGDSFTNIFTLEGMGWGSASGLAPHLALALGRPLDVIAQNDSGAFATRQALVRELEGGQDRLAGKRVLIWEFAARELSVGDWKPLELPAATQKPPEVR